MRRLTLVSVAIFFISSLSGAAGGSPDSTLSTVADQLHWRGTVDGPLSPHPGACSEALCDEFSFEVALPGASWSRPGGVQVGIRWAEEGDDLDLFVFDASGQEVASSEGVASTAESVLLPQVANGFYSAIITSRVEQLIEGRLSTDVLDEPVEYEGIVEVEWGTRVRPVRELLPNLVSFPARNVKFATGAYLFDPGLSLGGCYPDEMVEAGARRCLRFDQIIGNEGEGRLSSGSGWMVSPPTNSCGSVSF